MMVNKETKQMFCLVPSAQIITRKRYRECVPSRSVSYSVVLGLSDLNKHFGGGIIDRNAFKDCGTVISNCDAHVIRV